MLLGMLVDFCNVLFSVIKKRFFFYSFKGGDFVPGRQEGGGF